ncbi:membrane protein insertion efficiency factor YidD [Candidatus Roizmanbacteria bacterium CG22_combo_CG10-13_8_21_14_all_38_20]|uniref:Membrane protein insertion efficiency factor YidD n=1 Tax=Candidatus Roizmanbacteria bacterium CG22_combo_CG10-13_8_21_14_all_38_20 TaxID=1974862 RepID=A0A2H0BUA5_9BACT|nr:MAG: membrane protein insertion efficiency factor YidD [Candidatus Roizmanbacteria bacterium CG22_combo_CG10-13_8_21_14_all_38_20]PJC32412.1 MAG: membrane protein insertion efficiency factor YidD [Candidatus Roizmanbacteria bacterium CG_4_9_14_0_2_um_filter_38_17]
MRNIVVQIIKAYRHMPFAPKGACRFIPSCSTYCEESILSHGTIIGSLLCMRRVLRCNPILTKELTHDPIE